MSRPALAVVVVTYRSAPTVEACLASLPEALGEVAAEVVVVDNASDDGTLERVAACGEALAATRLALDVVARPANDGFGAACNDGWRRTSAPWVLFLNPDTRAPAGSLAALLEVAGRLPAAGVVAPALVGPDGRLQPSVERFLDARRVVLGTLRIGGANRPAPPPPSGPPVAVPWVHAAAVLVPRALLERLGGFDAGYFLYAEDMDLCARAAAAGARTYVVPEVRVEHLGGVSAARSGGAPMVAARRVEGLARFLEVHEGRGARAVALAAVLVGGTVAAIGQRAQRREGTGAARAAAAWRLLRAGRAGGPT